MAFAFFSRSLSLFRSREILPASLVERTVETLFSSLLFSFSFSSRLFARNIFSAQDSSSVENFSEIMLTIQPPSKNIAIFGHARRGNRFWYRGCGNFRRHAHATASRSRLVAGAVRMPPRTTLDNDGCDHDRGRANAEETRSIVDPRRETFLASTRTRYVHLDNKTGSGERDSHRVPRSTDATNFILASLRFTTATTRIEGQRGRRSKSIIQITSLRIRDDDLRNANFGKDPSPSAANLISLFFRFPLFLSRRSAKF